jgi:hypothetical protein
MEATLFTGWVYDHLKPLTQELKVAHPTMLKAIAASKKKNDKVDSRKIADLLRCNLLPECYMAPSATRHLRRVLQAPLAARVIRGLDGGPSATLKTSFLVKREWQAIFCPVDDRLTLLVGQHRAIGG